MTCLQAWRGLLSLGLLLAALVVGTVGQAQEPKKDKEGPGKADKQPAATKRSEAAPSAAAVPFAKQLGITTDSLLTLGARVQHARGNADPVALAGAAQELAAYEQLASKKATLTADALRKEAAALALARAVPAELRVVALLGGEAGRKDLEQAAEACEKFDKEQADALKRGEQPRGIQNIVYIHNRTDDDTIKAWANGTGGVIIPRGQVRWIYVGDAAFNTTTLYAIGSDGNRYMKSVERPNWNYNWYITED